MQLLDQGMGHSLRNEQVDPGCLHEQSVPLALNAEASLAASMTVREVLLWADAMMNAELGMVEVQQWWMRR